MIISLNATHVSMGTVVSVIAKRVYSSGWI